MKTPADTLASRYRLAHNEMRNIDGLQPSEALDELLKYLLFKSYDEGQTDSAPKLDAYSKPKQIKDCVRLIRKRLELAIISHGGFINDLFRHPDFSMSDSCLVRVHEIMHSINLSKLNFDVRSAALRSFLSPEIRKGLGIFLTPDEVVLEISEFFTFLKKDKILDPACGSGTFLMAALSQAMARKIDLEITGIDKSPRMMLLAELNIGNHKGGKFSGIVADTLRHSEYADRIRPASVDYILTNPPFGINIDSENYNLDTFSTAITEGRKARKQSSELLFVEQSLRLLKPDGWLAVVLPKSAINANAGEHARQSLDKIGAVRALIDLPSETFAATGTMTNTVVLFVQKFGKQLSSQDKVTPISARLENIGFDNTGRVREGSQLPGLGQALRLAIEKAKDDPRIERQAVRKAGQTFSTLPDIVKGHSGRLTGRKTIKLAEVVEVISTGTTPPRASYSDTGLFLVKVGNLTGSGVNWIARERNFVDTTTTGRRYAKESMVLKEGDILLTSSAHSPRYIAKKIDIISSIPKWAGGCASYVGEVMLVRPHQEKIDPYRLVAYLRLPPIVDEIQRMIRGQTAHLHSGDLLDLEIDKTMLFSSREIGVLADLVKEEAKIAERLNEISWQQFALSNRLLDQSSSEKLVA